ncbi:MAG: hypothetical protein Q8N99_08350 [Nanoarchaeota archaeon]|nr:hypothetical protein [Nanoarchaeota archaeon]
MKKKINRADRKISNNKVGKNIKLREMSVGKLFSITKIKLILDFVLSLILVSLILSYVSDINNAFMNETLAFRIIDVILNTLIFMIILYPVSCILSTWLFKAERI